jgi:hypothetical protein
VTAVGATGAAGALGETAEAAPSSSFSKASSSEKTEMTGVMKKSSKTTIKFECGDEDGDEEKQGGIEGEQKDNTAPLDVDDDDDDDDDDNEENNRDDEGEEEEEQDSIDNDGHLRMKWHLRHQDGSVRLLYSRTTTHSPLSTPTVATSTPFTAGTILKECDVAFPSLK